MKPLRYLSVVILLFAVLTSFKHPKKQKVNWINLAELKDAYRKEPKPIIIGVYTTWSGWCKAMEKETYSHDDVANYINENYYAVKFDAETKDSVEFAEKKYGYNAGYKANELAVHLLEGHMGYPATILLPTTSAQPAPLPGFLKPSELEPKLRFIGEGAYKQREYPDYVKDFTAKW
jgi:thioredoxin-related protein